jgi:hypothetical protein
MTREKACRTPNPGIEDHENPAIPHTGSVSSPTHQRRPECILVVKLYART